MGQDRSTGRRTRLALLVIVLIGLGVRGAYLASDPYPNPQTLLEGEMAHNIVAHGRWLEIDEGVNPALTRRAEREHRLIDPSEYSRLHGRPLWQAEVFQPGRGA